MITSGSCLTAAQRLLKIGNVEADLALADERHLRFERILYGVFDGDDVTLPMLIDVVDHRRQSRRLATAGHSTNDDQPVVHIGSELLVDCRQVQTGKVRYLRVHAANGGVHSASGMKHAAAIAVSLRIVMREIDAALLLDLLSQEFGNDRRAVG